MTRYDRCQFLPVSSHKTKEVDEEKTYKHNKKFRTRGYLLIVYKCILNRNSWEEKLNKHKKVR